MGDFLDEAFVESMGGEQLVNRSAMHHFQTAERANNRKLIGSTGKLGHDARGPEEIAVVTAIKEFRVMGAGLQVEGVDMTGATFKENKDQVSGSTAKGGAVTESRQGLPRWRRTRHRQAAQQCAGKAGNEFATLHVMLQKYDLGIGCNTLIIGP